MERRRHSYQDALAACHCVHPSDRCRWVNDAESSHLRGRANEAWPGCTRSVFHTVENPGDSVGFCEEGGVADSK